jgi:hypothetical protein
MSGPRNISLPLVLAVSGETAAGAWDAIDAAGLRRGGIDLAGVSMIIR